MAHNNCEKYVRDTYGMQDATDTILILIDMIAQSVSAIIFGTIYAVIIAFFLKNKS